MSNDATNPLCPFWEAYTAAKAIYDNAPTDRNRELAEKAFSVWKEHFLGRA